MCTLPGIRRWQPCGLDTNITRILLRTLHPFIFLASSVRFSTYVLVFISLTTTDVVSLSVGSLWSVDCGFLATNENQLPLNLHSCGVDQELLTIVFTLAVSPFENRSLFSRKWPIQAPILRVDMVKATGCRIFLHWAA